MDRNINLDFKQDRSNKIATKLPIITYKGKKYFVDFRLGEIRNIKTAKPIRFTKLREGVNSPIKKKLRSLRSKTWHNVYIEGIDT